ncbi:hypothetical protein [Streptomyces sp. OP7]|uniref:hypothetical protein n=1 Tax=Streptomyces sp. OP7 TaxID=3142462 RepID=UPI0032E8E7C2
MGRTPYRIPEGRRDRRKEQVLQEEGADSTLFTDKERALITLTDQSTRRVEVDADVMEHLKRL